MHAEEILDLCKRHVSTYLTCDSLPIVVAVGNPRRILVGISIQRNFPLTLIERSYGVPFGRFRSDAVRLLSDPDELHGYKWSIQTHEAIFEADASTENRLRTNQPRPVMVQLSTGLGNVLQNLRSIAYVDRAPLMVVGERPDHPPPYASLVEYSTQSGSAIQVGVELLLFSELGGCQRVKKSDYLTAPVKATMEAEPKFEDQLRWAVSGYPLVLNSQEVTLELTTRNVSDFRHVWRLPKLQHALVDKLATISRMEDADKRIEFYFGFDEIREKRNFVLATRDEPLRLPLELSMTEEWVETMCNVCHIDEQGLRQLPEFDQSRYAIRYSPNDIRTDFVNTDYKEVTTPDRVRNKGEFFVDEERQELIVRLLPAIYPHHIVGIDGDGNVVNVSICGQSGRSGITIEDARRLCIAAGLTDALIFDNGNDVFARLEGRHTISHEKNIRQTRLTAALHFASLLDPGPMGGFELVSESVVVRDRVVNPNA